MPYVSVHIDADEILEELTDEELISELESRGKDYNGTNIMKEVLQTLYEKRRLGKDYQSELDELIFGILGKII